MYVFIPLDVIILMVPLWMDCLLDVNPQILCQAVGRM